MQKLTSGQVSAILSLHETVPAIKSASISSGTHGVWVDVHAKDNADWNDCDMALYLIFPNVYYEGKPREHEEDGMRNKIYRIFDRSGVHVSLYMKNAFGQNKKVPASTETPKECSHHYSTIDLEKVESLMGREKYLEFHENRDGLQEKHNDYAGRRPG